MVLLTLSSVRRSRLHGASSSTQCRKSFVTRTELFEFWPETVPYAAESQPVSYSANSIFVTPCAPSCSARWM